MRQRGERCGKREIIYCFHLCRWVYFFQRWVSRCAVSGVCVPSVTDGGMWAAVRRVRARSEARVYNVERLRAERGSSGSVCYRRLDGVERLHSWFSRAIGAWVVPGAVVGHHSGFVFIFLTVV